MNTGKISIPYITGILEKWHQKGVHTLQQAQEEDAVFQKKKRTQEAAPKNKGTKFTNFQQDKLDFSELERRALARRTDGKG